MELCTGENQKINAREKIQSTTGRNGEGETMLKMVKDKGWHIVNGAICKTSSHVQKNKDPQ